MRQALINSIRFIFALFSLILFLQKSPYAAEQGEKDEEQSEGNIYIDLKISEITSISNLDDFNFSDWSESEDETIEQSDDVCVYSNKLEDTKYAITASGSGTNSAFAVTSEGGDEEIPYQVYWNDKEGTDSGRKELTANTMLTNQKKANNKSFDCEGSNNARVSIAFDRTDIESAIITGLYSGTLFIAISPE